MKKTTYFEKQSCLRKINHNIDLLDIGRIYDHPNGGIIMLKKSLNQITTEDGNAPQVPPERLSTLQRLAEVSRDDTGQSQTIGRFLLDLYNGHAYPFNLVSLRGLDVALHDDCMAVLRSDYEPKQEVHQYIADGHELIKQLRHRLTQKG